jgi:excisionase family DNA binding protein
MIKPRERGNDTMNAPTSTTRATLPALLSVTKAAEILGISRASAYRYAASGELPTRRLGGRVYVVTARLMDIVEGEAA